MKKIIITVIATSMLLTNIAFASTKPVNTDSSKNKSVFTVSQNNMIHLATTDPH